MDDWPPVRKFKLGEEPSDLIFWLSKTENERLAAVEVLRQRYMRWVKGGTGSEFQRVYRIVEQERG